MNNILTNKNISLEVRKQVLQCYINYGCESWTLNKCAQHRNNLNVVFKTKDESCVDRKETIP